MNTSCARMLPADCRSARFIPAARVSCPPTQTVSAHLTVTGQGPRQREPADQQYGTEAARPTPILKSNFFRQFPSVNAHLWGQEIVPGGGLWIRFLWTFKEGSNGGGPPNSSSDRIRTRPKRKRSKRRFSSRRQPVKANEERAGLGVRGSSLHQRCERETDDAQQKWG